MNQKKKLTLILWGIFLTIAIAALAYALGKDFFGITAS